jgi:hypothetical protein
MTVLVDPPRPPAWAVLAEALRHLRPVQVRYHGHVRLLCPHALGWKNGRPKVLSYQAAGTTSTGGLPDDPRQRWRSMFVDEIDELMVTEHRWESADNNQVATSNCFDQLELAVDR